MAPTPEPGRFPDLSSDHALPAENIDAFRSDGHVCVRGLASREEVDAYRPSIRAVVDAVAARHDPQGRIDDYSRLFTQVTNAWRLDESVRRFVFSRRFAGVAARLMGVTGVRLYHDQALFKEPGGQPTPWHRDQYYWPLDTGHMVTLWMALVDVSPEMGPMTFASGSHRAEDVPSLPIGSESGATLAAYVAAKGFPLAGGALSAGDATFHSARTLHSARPNLSEARREVMTVIYFADGARLRAPENPFQETDARAFLPRLKPGERARSALNPRLYPTFNRSA
jgi:ectoine hydroxylase-related dioxygenase (phytanoyl-CoA dioxygenase family)